MSVQLLDKQEKSINYCTTTNTDKKKISSAFWLFRKMKKNRKFATTSLTRITKKKTTKAL